MSGSPSTSRAEKLTAEPLRPLDPSGETFRHELSELLHECLDDAPFKWEEIAQDLDVDASLLSHWANNRTPIPAFRIPELVAKIGPRFLRAIARECGYELVPLTHAKARREPGS